MIMFLLFSHSLYTSVNILVLKSQVCCSSPLLCRQQDLVWGGVTQVSHRRKDWCSEDLPTEEAGWCSQQGECYQSCKKSAILVYQLTLQHSLLNTFLSLTPGQDSVYNVDHVAGRALPQWVRSTTGPGEDAGETESAERLSWHVEEGFVEGVYMYSVPLLYLNTSYVYLPY